MKSRKAQSMSASTIITVILVLAIIAVLLFFIFRAQIVEFVRTLPGYTPGAAEDKIVKLDAQTKSQYCNFIAARLANGKDIVFCKDTDCTSTIQSRLFLSGTDKEWTIYFNKKWNEAGRDYQVGEMKDGKVIFSDDGLLFLLFAARDKSLFEGETTGFTATDMAVYNLQGSTFFSGYFCRPASIDVNAVEKQLNGEKIASVDYKEISEYENEKNAYISIIGSDGKAIQTPFYLEWKPTGGSVLPFDLMRLQGESEVNLRVAVKWKTDPIIGKMINDGIMRIEIDSAGYQNIKNDKMPPYDSLLKLDRALYYAGSFYAQKDMSQKVDSGAWPLSSNIPLINLDASKVLTSGKDYTGINLGEYFDVQAADCKYLALKQDASRAGVDILCTMDVNFFLKWASGDTYPVGFIDENGFIWFVQGQNTKGIKSDNKNPVLFSQSAGNIFKSNLRIDYNQVLSKMRGI